MLRGGAAGAASSVCRPRKATRALRWQGERQQREHVRQAAGGPSFTYSSTNTRSS
jgi:hypothetical protein